MKLAQWHRGTQSHDTLSGARWLGIAQMASALALLSMLTFTLSACSLGGATSPTTTPTATTQPSATATPALTGYPIKVYFSKDPETLNTYGLTFPVARVSPSADLKTFALQLLIAGPSPEERSQGYFSELNSILTGASQCATTVTGGPDLSVLANMKGSTPEQGTFTVKFCRQTQSPGIGADARIQAEINATLKQFPDVKKVVILTLDGNCFGDMSTQNLCLK